MDADEERAPGAEPEGIEAMRERGDWALMKSLLDEIHARLGPQRASADCEHEVRLAWDEAGRRFRDRSARERLTASLHQALVERAEAVEEADELAGHARMEEAMLDERYEILDAARLPIDDRIDVLFHTAQNRTEVDETHREARAAVDDAYEQYQQTIAEALEWYCERTRE
jgi:hypothetical protein